MKSSIRLIASDIDGTLLQNGATAVSETLFAQIRALRERGIYFCAASGRQHGSLRKLFAPVDGEIFYLCENGAICFDSDGNIVSKTPVERALALQVSHEILSVPQFEVLISGAETSYLIPKSADFVDHIRYFVGNDVTLISRPEEIQEDIIKVSAYCPDGALQYQESWQKKYPALQVALGDAFWMDTGVASKREGIAGICAHLGIDPAEVMAFGDNYNDLPMLTLVGHPYLMEGASEELKAQFSRRTPRPEDTLAALLADAEQF